MSSYKSMFMIAALAILGGIFFSQFAAPPALTFVLGVVAAAFILKLSHSNAAQPQSDDQSTKTLYVGNLPYRANEANVRELFAKYGEVFAVRLMKDKRTGKRRGFGFVVIAAADAPSAIQALNEQDYMQRTLKVRIANDPKSQADETEPS